MKFSIIIPSLNSKYFLNECLKSIIQQSYTNYEVIVIDGDSNDGTVEFLKTFGDKIKWISEKDNGQADAINKGIAMSSGNWITWQNCDDYYVNKDALSIFSKAIISSPNLLKFAERIEGDILINELIFICIF